MSVRVRFAPSPTGGLHVGNVRTAVLNWLFARRHGGAFVLRIEDTDVQRNLPGAEAVILDDLRWLGLRWDEGPDTPAGHGHGPYRQSQRTELYRAHAARLREAGAAYPCFCPPGTEGEEARDGAAACPCGSLSAREVAGREGGGATPALRLRAPERGEIVVEDVVRGRVRFDAAEIGDFVLLRAGGLPTYNFAAVVDDALMEISHVIRGVGHLSNTPRQLLIYGALGWAPPVFAHIPTILGADRQKLSKRHGARPLSAYRAEGYLPESLVNYLSLLSWSSPSGEEVLPIERLIREVSLERIRSADAVFDPEKLRWLGARWIEHLPLEELVRRVRPFLDDARFPLAEEALPVALEAIRSHLSTLGELNDHLHPFVATRDGAVLGERGRSLGPEAAPVLRAAAATLAGAQPWAEAPLGAALKAAGREAGVRGAGLYVPLRRALTGEEHGPPLVAVLRVQGRGPVLNALELAAAGAAGEDEAPAVDV
ncbi:MAG TPA: glutamate--tRNA ligase [Longimicrobiales bacterium]|nr:glutamate--tRNA ligase [Longimicrobiales bacterium]